MKEEIIEEDWSHILNTATHDDVHINENLFSYYQAQTFSLTFSRKKKKNDKCRRDKMDIVSSDDEHARDPIIMKLCCLESLTPLDMLDLSNGVADATGSRVWLGAQWFMKCMVIRPLPSSFDASLLNTKTYFALLKLRNILFHGKRILELGAGTGASLISLGLASIMSASNVIIRGTNNIEDPVIPLSLKLTDNDPVVLSLCQRNCDTNLSSTGIDYKVVKLEWGKEHFENVTTTSTLMIEQASQDTIVATDVIYDLSALKPLMETTSILLKKGGYFVLSHIPRASIEDCELKDIIQALEHEIQSEASKHNLMLLCPASYDREEAADIVTDVLDVLIPFNDHAIRPASWMKCWNDDTDTYQASGDRMMSDTVHECEELESVGASIMIFVRL
mmetsp:Transcript_12515/g.23494  ORF Transcript_12515/g.23494 Transcript_12515/m.23494 type:complete len:391 (+) Transcript_12515:137-1309(+)